MSIHELNTFGDDVNQILDNIQYGSINKIMLKNDLLPPNFENEIANKFASVENHFYDDLVQIYMDDNKFGLGDDFLVSFHTKVLYLYIMLLNLNMICPTPENLANFLMINTSPEANFKFIKKLQLNPQNIIFKCFCCRKTK